MDSLLRYLVRAVCCESNSNDKSLTSMSNSVLESPSMSLPQCILSLIALWMATTVKMVMKIMVSGGRGDFTFIVVT